MLPRGGGGGGRQIFNFSKGRLRQMPYAIITWGQKNSHLQDKPCQVFIIYHLFTSLCVLRKKNEKKSKMRSRDNTIIEVLLGFHILVDILEGGLSRGQMKDNDCPGYGRVVECNNFSIRMPGLKAHCNEKHLWKSLGSRHTASESPSRSDPKNFINSAKYRWGIG